MVGGSSRRPLHTRPAGLGRQQASNGSFAGLAWERAVGRAWAAVLPIGPIGPAFSGRAWMCPWAGIEAQARPGYRARAVPSPIIFGPVPCSGRANMGRASGPMGIGPNGHLYLCTKPLRFLQ